LRAGKKKLRVPRVLSFYQCYAIVPVKQHKKEHKGTLGKHGRDLSHSTNSPQTHFSDLSKSSEKR
jgi:hypothetical protein